MLDMIFNYDTLDYSYHYGTSKWMNSCNVKQESLN